MGIGRGIALGFARAGADIVLADIDPTAAESTAAQVRSLGRRALALAIDVCNHAQVSNMVGKALGEFGYIDILVNNVGGTLGLYAPVTNTTEEDWDKCIALNLKATFLCCREVGNVMVARRQGNIINMTSMSGLGPRPNIAPYGAAKAAVINLTQTLAIEMAPYQIRVNCIAPGIIATPLTEQIFAEHPEIKEQRLKTTPLGYMGHIEDVAAAAIYLASDASSFVTGETLRVTGGCLPSSEVQSS